MKKITALLLCGAMCLLNTNAFATEENNNVTTPVTNEYEKVIMDVDFENFDVSNGDYQITSEDLNKKMDGMIGTISKLSGGDVYVINDNGNKVMKTDVASNLEFSITPISAEQSGIITLTYDIKEGATSKFSTSIPALISKGESKVVSFASGWKNYYYKNMPKDYICSFKDMSDYWSYKIDINTATKECTYYKKTHTSPSYSKFVTLTASDNNVDRFHISLSTNTTYNNGDYNDVKYFDNIKITVKAPVVKEVKINGDFVENGMLTGNFDILYDTYSTDTTSYRWLACDTKDGEYTPLDGDEYKSKSIAITDAVKDKYLKLEVTPCVDGVSGKTVTSNPVCLEQKPVANRVWVSGALLKGDTLTGNLEFFDANDDEEGEHIFIWYSCDENGENRTEIARGKTYTIPEDSTYEYIVLGAYAVSKRAPTTAENEVFSEVVKEALPPEAKNVRIEGETAIGATLKGKFDFYDPNNDEQGTHIYNWYRCDDANGNGKTPIGDNTDTYVVTNDDISKYIFFEVKPVSKNAPTDGIKFYPCNTPYVAPQKPIAENVRIIGDAISGYTLTGDYDYKHYFNIPEKGSTYKWIASANASPANGSVIGTGATLALTNEYVGKYVFFEVTPSCYEEPSKGESYVSAGVLVKAPSVTRPSSSISIGGGVSSGGGSISIGSGSSSNTATPNKKNNFGDTATHWAKYEIDRAYSLGIINGISDTQFAPENCVTSAQYLTMVMRAIGISYSNKVGNDWYSEYVKKAKELKFIDDSFAPDVEITREDMAVIAVKAYEYKSKKVLSEKASDFSDANSISTDKASYINKAVNGGILKGMGDGTFSPKANTTRAQGVTVILRLMDIL